MGSLDFGASASPSIDLPSGPLAFVTETDKAEQLNFTTAVRAPHNYLFVFIGTSTAPTGPAPPQLIVIDTTTTTPSKGRHGLSKKDKLLIVILSSVGGALIILVAGTLLYCLCFRAKAGYQPI